MKCEQCEKEHNGSYATGRFCNVKCSRAFSTRSNREMRNRRISLALTGKPGRKSLGSKHSEETKRKISETVKSKLKYKPFEELTSDSARRRALLRELGHICSVCTGSEWMGQPMPVELDHIDGDPGNNARSNCRLICPNCHAQTPTYKGRNRFRLDENVRYGSRKQYRNRERV